MYVDYKALASLLDTLLTIDNTLNKPLIATSTSGLVNNSTSAPIQSSPSIAIENSTSTLID